MRKQTWIVNVLLLAAAAALTVKVRGDWLRANHRYAALAAPAKPGTTPSAGVPGLSTVPPGAAETIVASNLFNAERNNTVAPFIEKKGPPPTEPTLIGAMDLGRGPMAVMIDNSTPNSQPKQLRQDEMIGGYKIVKIDPRENYVEIEFDGQKKRIDPGSAVRQVSAPQGLGTTVGIEPPRSTKTVEVSTSRPGAALAPNTPTPGNPTGNSTGNADTRSSFDMFGPGVADKYPSGAVVDGWRKVEKPWPFGGKQVWWEKVK